MCLASSSSCPACLSNNCCCAVFSPLPTPHPPPPNPSPPWLFRCCGCTGAVAVLWLAGCWLLAPIVGPSAYPLAWSLPAAPEALRRGCSHLPSPSASLCAHPSLASCRAHLPPTCMRDMTSSCGSRSAS